ncbi:MAG TPA: DnaA/Hda family protein [Methyloceanibacter sp.]|nr:DnaA/Hda family protein [Methyloceanibacter sp.]
MTVKQLSLDLPHRAALGAEDFLVSECNRGAVRLIDSWPEWSDNAQLIIGPAASGKTHLVRVWQARSGAETISPADLEVNTLESMTEGTPLVVEDVDRAGYDEKALFHLLNLTREKRLFVLLSGREAPNRFDYTLPDLRSRLNALPAVRIGAPDDALLKTVMLKHFADRQLSIDPKVLEFLALRIERSLAAAAEAVAAIDRATLGSGRKISRQLVAEVLGTEVSPD